MKADAKALVQRCERYQKHTGIEHALSSELQLITSPWPFAHWGLDILRPFLPAPDQKTRIIIACDYFTKWVEAEAMVKVTERNMRSFVYNNILVRFGVRHSLVMDNGRQFDCKGMRDFCEKYGITAKYTSVAHPQSNSII